MKSKPTIESIKDKIRVYCPFDNLDMIDYKIKNLIIRVEQKEIRGKVEWK
jgi:hypothetical protein